MEGFQITVGPIKTDNIYLGVYGDQQSDLIHMLDNETLGEHLKIYLCRSSDAILALLKTLKDNDPSEKYQIDSSTVNLGCELVKLENNAPVYVGSSMIEYTDAIKKYAVFSGEVEYMFECPSITAHFDKHNKTRIVSYKRVVPMITKLTAV